MAPPRSSSSSNPIITNCCKPELFDDHSPTPRHRHSWNSASQTPHLLRPVRIIHIKTPTVIKTHPSLFRSLVQQLTGNHSSPQLPPPVPQSIHSSSFSSDSPPVSLAIKGSPCSHANIIAPSPLLVPFHTYSPVSQPPITTFTSDYDPPIPCFHSSEPPLPPQLLSPPHLPLLLTPHAFMAQQSFLPFADVKPAPPTLTSSSPSFTIHRQNPMPHKASLFVSAPGPLQRNLTGSRESSHSSSQLAYGGTFPVSPPHALSSCLSSDSSLSPILSREWRHGECATNDTDVVVLSRQREYEMDGETSHGSDVDMVGSVSNDGEEEKGMKRTWKQKVEGEAMWRLEESSPSLICGGDNQSNISSLSSDSGGSCDSTEEWDIIWGLLSASPLMEASHSLPPLVLPLQEINTSLPIHQSQDQITLNRRSRQIPARFL